MNQPPLNLCIQVSSSVVARSVYSTLEDNDADSKRPSVNSLVNGSLTSHRKQAAEGNIPYTSHLLLIIIQLTDYWIFRFYSDDCSYHRSYTDVDMVL